MLLSLPSNRCVRVLIFTRVSVTSVTPDGVSPRPRSQPHGGRQCRGLVSSSVKAVQAFPVLSLFPQISGSFLGNHTLQDLNLELAGLKMDFER